MRTPLSKQLTDKSNSRDFLAFRIQSMNDQDFTAEMNRDPVASVSIRASVHTAELRENCIKNYEETGRLNAPAKHVTTLMKLGDRRNLTDYLHSLDDKSLKAVANEPSIRETIEHNNALAHRYMSIVTTKSPPRVSTIAPIYFSLNESRQTKHREIQMTGNVNIDTETLLLTPQDQIDDVLDPEKYHQDDVVREIRSIIVSPNYVKRRLVIDGDYACPSPYKGACKRNQSALGKLD